jgi:low affinity Fe/Cu permease
VVDPSKRHWTTHVGQAAGHPAAFLVVIVYALLWLISDRASFDWNAVATLAVFVMTLFIQRANRRDNLALHAKLDELLRVDHAARSELTQLDEQDIASPLPQANLTIMRSQESNGVCSVPDSKTKKIRPAGATVASLSPSVLRTFLAIRRYVFLQGL